ncbi:MAG: transketolase [Pseudomonadota bacterium]|nr:transketolase [Pseudomonadota bacterium]
MPSRRELANVIRVLSMDAVQKAKSGHPGAPMGMADIAEVLWNDFLRHNPANPKWSNRDRFVMSNGHGSMLIYALLHLSGYDLSIDDIKNFRQLHSKTPGHPEYGVTPGIETTTGPLGQGLANAVGMAIAEKVLADQFNRDDFPIVDHYTYVFAGDGCLMEGVSHEACSLAGTLGLGKLICFYDDNGISIDGEVEGWFTDDTARRFESYGWHVIRGIDGHDPEAVRAAVDVARQVEDRPSLLCCKTVIGWGAPTKAGTESVHGAPLGDEEIAAAREQLSWPHAPFEIPGPIREAWDARSRGAELEQSWDRMFDAYRSAFPELAAEFERRITGDLPAQWSDHVARFVNQVAERGETIATRKASQQALEGLAPLLPELTGGSADLTGSNLTKWSGSIPLSREGADANYIYFGVREFGMSAIQNGLALHGGFIAYSGTFLVFSDYARNAIRMAALMNQGSIFVYTHDSIGLGEDGPTHQPIEHMASLRIIPNMDVWRPCDAVESVVAWQSAIERRDGPTCLVFSRQNCQHQERTTEQIALIRKGAYVLFDQGGEPDVILIATGSEVALAMYAAQELSQKGVRVRVVSMPSSRQFDRQDSNYRESVLPSTVTCRVAIEAGVTDHWYRYVGPSGKVIGIDRFGESAPAGRLMEYFGFTVDNVVATVESIR